MKFKRLLAGAMTFVFSLSMIHVGVSAEEFTEKATDEKEKITVVLKEEDVKEASEKEDVAKAETTEESTAKKVLVKVANGAKTAVFAVGNLGLSGIKRIFGLIKSAVEWIAVGACLVVGYELSDNFIIEPIKKGLNNM